MNCKILYLESSYPINSRSQRIIDSLDNYDVHVCTWDRANDRKNNTPGYSIYSSPNVGYGNKFTKALYLVKYANYFRQVIKKYNPDVIFASHWDMLFIAVLFKGHRKLIYDNIDIPEFKVKFVEKIIVELERLSLYRTDVMLLASRFYKNLYKKKPVILENLPAVKDTSVIDRVIENRTVKIGFVGSVRHFELLKNLILSVSSDSSLELHIYGDGIANEKLKEFCKTNEFENVHFHGAFKYNEISNIYSEIDILWAAYPYKSRNVKYAISNKFYESIHYKIPCLFSTKTMLGEYVKDENIGVTVDPYNVENIRSSIFLAIKNYQKIYLNLVDFSNKKNISWESNKDVLQKTLYGLLGDD